MKDVANEQLDTGLEHREASSVEAQGTVQAAQRPRHLARPGVCGAESQQNRSKIHTRRHLVTTVFVIPVTYFNSPHRVSAINFLLLIVSLTCSSVSFTFTSFHSCQFMFIVIITFYAWFPPSRKKSLTRRTAPLSNSAGTPPALRTCNSAKISLPKALALPAFFAAFLSNGASCDVVRCVALHYGILPR